MIAVKVRKVRFKEKIRMMVKQRSIVSYENVMFDESIGYGRNDAACYFRGDAMDPVADIKEVARAYFESNVRVPPEFPEVRAVLGALIS